MSSAENFTKSVESLICPKNSNWMSTHNAHFGAKNKTYTKAKIRLKKKLPKIIIFSGALVGNPKLYL